MDSGIFWDFQISVSCSCPQTTPFTTQPCAPIPPNSYNSKNTPKPYTLTLNPELNPENTLSLPTPHKPHNFKKAAFGQTPSQQSLPCAVMNQEAVKLAEQCLALLNLPRVKGFRGLGFRGRSTSSYICMYIYVYKYIYGYACGDFMGLGILPQ